MASSPRPRLRVLLTRTLRQEQTVEVPVDPRLSATLRAKIAQDLALNYAAERKWDAVEVIHGDPAVMNPKSD